MSRDAYNLTGMGWIHRFSLQRTLGEVLSKRWAEAIVPVILLVMLLCYFIVSTPGFLGEGNVQILSQSTAELGLVCLGMTIVLLGGGIDLSVGAIVAVVNGFAVMAFKLWEWPLPAVIVGSLALGALMGGVNGVLISALKTRPFITTLVTLLAYRTIAQYIDSTYSSELAVRIRLDDGWTMIGAGFVGGLSSPLVTFLVVAVMVHILLSRTRWGWRVTALGSSRSATRRAGISLGFITFSTYLVSGLLAGLAGLLIASRMESASATTAVGMEFAVLTAVVLGGVSLAGGRGTAARAVIGAAIVGMIGQGLILQGQSRHLYSIILALTLLAFATLDLKWGRNRGRAIQKIYLVPGRMRVDRSPDLYAPGSVWASNRRLTGAYPIGKGVLDGPEDVVVDDAGVIYCGDRRGLIWRIPGPDAEPEILARIGGHPLGVALDHNGDVLVCVAGMGLYRVTKAGEVSAVATDVPRKWFKINDDSAIRLADDLDITEEGDVYFSDASTRFDGDEYNLDILEGRPNGRLLRWNPRTGKTTVELRNYPFPNGVCIAHDGQSVLINSSTMYRIDRYWIKGPNKGKLELVVQNLPGIPDNINRASDGNYWVAFAGMRTPSWDLAMRDPAFRRRMVRQVPMDEWMMANLNTSCVIKLSEDGEVLESLWDAEQGDHAVITSMREHDGYLYLGGLTNNRLGRIRVNETRTQDQREAVLSNG